MKLERGDWRWLIGAIAAAGVVAPLLLMVGLTRMPASSASLLLNAEGMFTALLAWFVFRENFDRRIAVGMLAIAAGAIVLSWPDELRFTGFWPALFILAACLGWAIDNNLTRKVSLSNATWIAAVKGLGAGTINLLLALAQGAMWPSFVEVAAAMSVGLLSYGVSLSLFVLALRTLGTARTGAYFSVAPFFGAILSVPLLAETVTYRFLVAGARMSSGSGYT